MHPILNPGDDASDTSRSSCARCVWREEPFVPPSAFCCVPLLLVEFRGELLVEFRGELFLEP
jgi:hypothetical protein